MPDNSIQPNTTLPRTPAGSYTVYTAILNQTGTNAPVATILKNNIVSDSGDIVWTRQSAGKYKASATNGFPAGKTWVIFEPQNKPNYMTCWTTIVNTTDITFEQSYLDPRQSDDGFVDGMINAMIEIRVYS